MLLSTLALEQLEKLESQTKRDRIYSFIREQKQHLPYYTSAVDDTDFRPSSYHYDCRSDNDNDDDDDDDNESDDLSDFTSSISEIIRRKYEAEQEDQRQKKLNAIREGYITQSKKPYRATATGRSQCGQRGKNKRPKLASPSILSSEQMSKQTVQLQESITDRRGSMKNSSSNNNNNLPQTRANGFHLLQKFVSPNLEINRITVKQQHKQRKRPKIGLFNKGRSSANGFSVPELVFSESKFLKRKHKVATGHTFSAAVTVASKRHEEVLGKEPKQTTSVSRFFSASNRSSCDNSQRATMSSLNSTGFRVCRKKVPDAAPYSSMNEAASITAARGFGRTTSNGTPDDSDSSVGQKQNSHSYRLRNIHDLFAQSNHNNRPNISIKPASSSSRPSNYFQQQIQTEQTQHTHAYGLESRTRNASCKSTVSGSSSFSSNASLKQLLKECQESVLSYCDPNSSIPPDMAHYTYSTQFEQQPMTSANRPSGVYHQPHMPTYAAPPSCYYRSSSFSSERMLTSSPTTPQLYTSPAPPKHYYSINDDGNEPQQLTPSTPYPPTPSYDNYQRSYYHSNTTASMNAVATDPFFNNEEEAHCFKNASKAAISISSNNSSNDYSFSSPIQHEHLQQHVPTSHLNWQKIEKNYFRNNGTTTAVVTDTMIAGNDNSSSSSISIRNSNSNSSSSSSIVFLGSLPATHDRHSGNEFDDEDEEDEDLNLPNFWLEQSYRRKL